MVQGVNGGGPGWGSRMLGLEPRARSLLALALTGLALCFSVLAFATSYWCEGTHKVVKPPCLSAMRKGSCTVVSTNETSPANASADPNVVQYIWETGEDKYAFRYFHTGFWRSCEEHHGGECLFGHWGWQLAGPGHRTEGRQEAQSPQPLTCPTPEVAASHC